MKVLLASASPRRRELLKEIFYDFSVCSPDVDEKSNATPIAFVKEIAKRKANAVDLDADLIISADTIVVYKGEIIGKPHSKEEAIFTLKKIEGKKHNVYTGVCLKYRKDYTSEFKIKVFSVKSSVYLKSMTEEEILAYVETGSPLDKAGSYGIQDGVVEKHKGSYSNIVGLPLEKLKKVLKRINKL